MTFPSSDSTHVRIRAARLYLLATESVASGDWLVAVEAALGAGVGVVQLREKELPDDAFARRAVRLRTLCHEFGALFVVDDRVAVARDVGADGVHLGQEDMPVAEARAILGRGPLLGVSTHDAAEFGRALADGADYVGVGSVFPTSTKGRFVPVGSPAALAPLAARAEAAGVPAFAIGGITIANVGEVVAAGFRRIAVSAGVLSTDDPAAAVRAMRAALTPPA